jgi:hypothetical protein
MADASPLLVSLGTTGEVVLLRLLLYEDEVVV